MSYPIKLAIVGSRTFNDYNLLELTVKANYDVPNISQIISGGACGADKLAEHFAKNNNIETTIYKPDWNKYGKRAGYMRNVDIINAADHVLAFWDGNSKGTKHDIDIAIKYNKPLIIKMF